MDGPFPIPSSTDDPRNGKYSMSVPRLVFDPSRNRQHAAQFKSAHDVVAISLGPLK